MVSSTRQPLLVRRSAQHTTRTSKATSALTKRPHSPDGSEHHGQVVPKRPRTSNTIHKRTQETQKDADKRSVKAQTETVFREKYTNAFPRWKFYFDINNIQIDTRTRKALEDQIEELKGHIETFFSSSITHLISNSIDVIDKENLAKLSAMAPMESRARTDQSNVALGFDLIAKANRFNIKIWSTDKLASVLKRCLTHPHGATVPSRATSQPQRSLSRVLQSERIHGTSERDPTLRRHDVQYFSKGSHYMLVEDINEELASIAVLQYTSCNSDSQKPPWPVLHCHPQSRGPFVAFDEMEKRRWVKSRAAGIKQKSNSKKIAPTRALCRRKQPTHNIEQDLRRTVSLQNIKRMAVEDDELGKLVDLDEPSVMASGYVAASGNSVGIASTTGTTSTTGHSVKSDALSLRCQREVLTRRSVAVPKNPVMGPPPGLVIKKSRSMNSMRLPKRMEASKPGYCESCREKFDDFKFHTQGRKHSKFAQNDANFLSLDATLSRVRRRTHHELSDELLASFNAGIPFSNGHPFEDL